MNKIEEKEYSNYKGFMNFQIKHMPIFSANLNLQIELQIPDSPLYIDMVLYVTQIHLCYTTNRNKSGCHSSIIYVVCLIKMNYIQKFEWVRI